MSSPQRRYLLHIDDDEDDQMMLREVVSATDPSLQVRTAKNGQQGLELLFKYASFKDLPSLIILDLNMPGMDGKKLLLEIRKCPVLSTIPVVLFTTSSSYLDKLFAEKQKVELITKPSSELQFALAIKTVLEKLNRVSMG